MGFSSSKSSSEPKDMTPQAFKNLQQPFADVMSQLISGSGQTVQNLLSGYTGPTTTGVTANEQSLLDRLMGTTAVTPPGGGTTTPGTTPPATGGGMSSTVQDLLTGMQQSGQTPGAAAGFVDQLGMGPSQSLADFVSGAAGASGTGAFGGDPNANPFLQAYIDQAQRGTMQNLEETLSRTLPGRFTQAGQLVQPGSSSAFDRAAAIATRGATQEMGDIATRLSYQALSDAQNREAGLIGDELGRRGTMDQVRADAIQKQLDRSLAAGGLESDIKQTEAQTGKIQSDITSQEVDTLIKNLQAQALPRLIQDLGIERGMEAFQNQINSMLGVMGISAGVTAPVIGNSSSSKSTGFNLK